MNKKAKKTRKGTSKLVVGPPNGRKWFRTHKIEILEHFKVKNITCQ